MLQRLIIIVATIAVLSVSVGSREASAAGHRAGLGAEGHLDRGGNAWHEGPSGWHGDSAWHGGKGFSGWPAGRRWRAANVGWGFNDPFIGYPFFGYPYAESPNVLRCFRRIRVETLYGVSWQPVWICN
jgi:hypothetical protein